MSQIIERIHLFLANCKGETYSFFRYHGYRMSIPFRVWRIRHKKQIRVLFVVSDISMWKTESLYLLMLEHIRFHPMLLPVPHMNDGHADVMVKKYFHRKGYQYEFIPEDSTIGEYLHPDIIFYQQAYSGVIEDRFFEMKNRNALFCHVNYCFRNTLVKSTVDLPLLNIAWMVFSENEMCSKELQPLMRNKGVNLRNTGLPVMDDLIKPKENFPDRWKKLSHHCKRIIYAPHHSILDEDKLAWGSVLEYGDYVLMLAKKYKNETQWVFKPHPFLKVKLKQIWGEEKTEEFYKNWQTGDNTQLLEGDYLDVFKHSDAMIHDCGSFMIEYLYTHNPVMYLFSSRPQKDVGITRMSEEARRLHYPAYSQSDIESFVVNVILGHDPMKNEREAFFERHLTPQGDSACNNIIKAILG